eukprot:7958410-Pyramimonas_sp.AAC.2
MAHSSVNLSAGFGSTFPTWLSWLGISSSGCISWGTGQVLLTAALSRLAYSSLCAHLHPVCNNSQGRVQLCDDFEGSSAAGAESMELVEGVPFPTRQRGSRERTQKRTQR